MSDLSAPLRELAPDDPAAQERAWRLAQAAYVRRPAGRRAARRRPVAVTAAGVAVSLVLALTPAGGSMVELVKRVTSSAAPTPRTVARLHVVPGGGRLLALRGGAAYLIGSGSPARRLGPADEATFSAFGHYVATAHAGRLTVRAVDGRRVWSLAERGGVSALRWSPDGLRIAYRSGPLLRIVDGNGENPRTLGRAGGAALAWRPGAEPVLAYLRSPHVVAFVDAGTGRDLARVRPPAGTTVLAWSRDGRRLLALGPRELRLFDGRGVRVARRRAPRHATFVSAAFAPTARRLALVTRLAAGDVLSVAGRRAAGAPRLGAPVWSPDGRWLAVGEPGRGTLLLRPGRPPPATPRSAGDDTVAGWCCNP